MYTYKDTNILIIYLPVYLQYKSFNLLLRKLSNNTLIISLVISGLAHITQKAQECCNFN